MPSEVTTTTLRIFVREYRSAGDLVHEAPAPALAELDAPHDGVPGLFVVRRGMPARGGVAAADTAAVQAHPQRHPVGGADRQAVLAAVGVARDGDQRLGPQVLALLDAVRRQQIA